MTDLPAMWDGFFGRDPVTGLDRHQHHFYLSLLSMFRRYHDPVGTPESRDLAAQLVEMVKGYDAHRTEIITILERQNVDLINRCAGPRVILDKEQVG